MNEKALGLLGIARKGGFVQLGEDAVAEVVETGHARLILLASDAADHTSRKASSLAKLHSTPVAAVENTKESLGAVFGRSAVAMLAVTDINLAVHIMDAMDSPERYTEITASVHEKAALMKKRKLEKKNGRKKPATH